MSKRNYRERMDATANIVLLSKEFVADERYYQNDCFGDDHDDGHLNGELAKAAAVLLCHYTDAAVFETPFDKGGCDDYWGIISKHPDRLDQLVIAAALAKAELERYMRAEVKKEKPKSLAERLVDAVFNDGFLNRGSLRKTFESVLKEHPLGVTSDPE